MPQRMSGRSYPLRRRAASSVASFDAPSAAARTALSVSASYYSPLATASTDHQGQAEENAEKEEAGAREGGKMDGRALNSTASDVRVGLSVHSGQPSVPDTAATTQTTRITLSSRYSCNPSNIMVTEAICTIETCSHCCRCHLRHIQKGYGRCMRTATLPWSDCECVGACPPGRCAQPECVSNRVVVDLTAAEPAADSRWTSTLPATQPHPTSQHSHHPGGVSAVPHPGSPPSPTPGARRAAGGVHADEDVCIGPQANVHASSAAAFRQPSTTVVDSGIAASERVGRESEGGRSADVTTNTGADVQHWAGEQRVGATEVATTALSLTLQREQQTDAEVELVKAVLYKAPRAPSNALRMEELADLPHTPYAIYTLGGGRCSVTAPMLAVGKVPDSHANHHCQARIDAERIRLGETMREPTWSEERWLREVPLVLRMERVRTGWHVDPSKRSTPLTSYQALRQSLLDPAQNLEWLEPSVFHLTADLYNVGIFVIQAFPERGSNTTYYRHIRAASQQHIVVWFANGHYQCVQYRQQRVFPTHHEFVQRLKHLCVTHAQVERPEDDLDVQIIANRPAVSSVAHDNDSVPLPLAHDSPQRGYSSFVAEAVGETLPSLAAVASHPALYNVVSFRNVPMWVGANTPLWNAYRMASESGDEGAQVRAVLDVLLLPSFVLPRMGRGGRGSAQRKARIVNARCRSRIVTLTQRHGKMLDTEPNGEVRTIALPSATTMHRTANSPSSTATTDDDDDSVSPTVHKRADRAPVGARTRSAVQQLFQQAGSDQDMDAVKGARRLVTEKQIRRAAQRLHNTTTMADLTDPLVREKLVQLHPPLPGGAVIPARPVDSLPILLEDDEHMRRLIRDSNNGAAGGPSGWAGNMLSSLVDSALCRAGIIALLSDILNGKLPEQARQYLLSSRVVGLTKPDNGVRPIAIGEMFYRLAAVLAVRRVTAAAATLLSPHQYGVGVPGGGERILHSMQHTLTDKQARLAAAKIDISNAFNCCDRARLLDRLYHTPELSAIYRIADFAYSTPSTLLIERGDGDSIQSANGVRQGDPLSALLFCLYMRDVYSSVAATADVTLYAFVDDLHVVGKPSEVMKTLAALETALPSVSLACNTAKSHFAYFHAHTAPLPKSILDTLAGQNITVHEDWMEAVGAVVGRDEQAIRDGLAQVRHQAGSDAFFRRLQLDDMPVQSAMLLLRQCMVPKLNYLLRCSPPSCISDVCREFDSQVLAAAVDKLDLADDETTAPDTVRLLRARLKDGGFGLTSAQLTSPAAYLGSLAAAHSTPALLGYTPLDRPLPSGTLLHGWIDDSIARVKARTSDCTKHLPATAASFFRFYSTKRNTLARTLQRTLNTQATQHSFDASMSSARREWTSSKSMHDAELLLRTTRRLAHLRSISAPLSSLWKQAIPSTASLTLLDSQYRLAARLNLDLAPVKSMAPLPEYCPTCNRQGAFSDKWHCLICGTHQSGRGGVANRHHAVNRALCETAWTLGGQADMEVRGLLPGSRLRPDLRMTFHGEYLLSDVQVSHPLAPSYQTQVAGGRPLSISNASSRNKSRKYERLTKATGATFIPFIAESFGGLHADSLRLVGRMADASQQHLAMWSREQIVRHVLLNVAVAIQRENAATVLAGHAIVDMHRRAYESGDEEGASEVEEDDDEAEGESDEEEGEEVEEQHFDEEACSVYERDHIGRQERNKEQQQK